MEEIEIVVVGTLEIHHGSLFVMDETGDTRLQWDHTKIDEVEAAQARFDELKKKGYLAYRVNKSGDQGEVIDAFDAKAERIILSPAVVGG